MRASSIASNAATTPIIPGFYPDPTVCRVGIDYYLANSSFEYFPGAPLHHSTDLIHWTQIGNILTRRTQFRRGSARPSTGIYGSTLRHRDGRFWFITTNISDAESGMVLVNGQDPAGEWSDPVFVRDAIGIDPDLCWDDDGQCYLTWNAMSFTTGYHGVLQAPIELDTGNLLEQPYPVWQGSGLPAAEGPHLYQINGLWYLLLAEGGTGPGHCVTIARGPTPRGPFVGYPRNPVFTHRSTFHQVQNTGHADLVETPDGGWAAVYLGVRPQGPGSGFGLLGRETFLAGVNWVDGWPIFDEGHFEVAPATSAFTDDFSTPDLNLRWVAPGGEPDEFTHPGDDGGLIVEPGTDGSSSQLLCFRVHDISFRADAGVTSAAQFLLRLDDRHWCGLTLRDGVIVATVRIGGVEHQAQSFDTEHQDVVLRIESVLPSSPPFPFGDAGSDDIILSADDGTGLRELARVDGRYFSSEVASGFTGRVLALGAAGGTAHVRSIDYRPMLT